MSTAKGRSINRRQKSSTGRLPVQTWLGRRRARKLTAGGAVILFILLFLLSRLGSVSQGDWATYDHQQFTITKVVDGDTVHISQPEGNRSYTAVRFWGVDTPEIYHRQGDPPDQPFAQEAKAFVQSLALNQQVTIVLESRRVRDKYNRLLAYIMLPDGRSLNEQVLRQGLARADRRFNHDLYDRYLAIEAQAQADRLGLWQK